MRLFALHRLLLWSYFIFASISDSGLFTSALTARRQTVSMKLASEKFFVLGSGSFTRKLILTNAGYNFSVIKADIDEYAIGNRLDATKASELVLLLANAKADAIINSNKIPTNMTHEILLTADQVVTYDNNILEKPKDIEEARKFIEGYGLLPCSTVGSIVLTDLNTNQRVEGVDICTIYFDPIPPSIIQQLLDEGEVINCAGGLMVEHPLVLPYRKKIIGTEESVMGLSLELLASLLEKLKKL